MRLIDADALKAKLEKKTDMNDPRWSFDSMMIAKITIQVLDKAPTVEERKRGHWIELEPDKYGNFIQCSVCNSKFGLYSKDNYCQACGAIMDI